MTDEKNIKKLFVYHTAIGRISILAKTGVIFRITTEEIKGTYALEETPAHEKAIRQITEYLAGKRKVFGLDISVAGTYFQNKVWQALMEIPYGETRTYGEIARIVDSPKAARAVGMACNKNPILLAIPCHRVIGHNGNLTGFACGLDMKKQLLDLESGKYNF